MKKLFALLFAALFVVSFAACGDEEESGNACETLASKTVKTYEDYCDANADCGICDATESTDESPDEAEELTDEQIQACQVILDDYETLYETPTTASWDTICAM